MKSIIDGLYVDQLFQKNERGETIYYPYGMMGRGYLLSAEREARVRNATRLLMLVSLVVGISLGLFLLRVLDSSSSVAPAAWVIAGALLALLLGAIFYFQSRLVKGLEPVSGPRPGAGEWLRGARRARATWTQPVSVVLGVLCLLLSAGGFLAGDLLGLASGLFMMLVGGLLMWDGVLGLIERSRAK